MQDLIDAILAAFPTIKRLDWPAELIDDKVVLNGRFVGINDKQEGGYVRTDGEPRLNEKQFTSKAKTTEIFQPYVLVIGFRNTKLVSYVDRLLSVMTSGHEVTIDGLEMQKDKIIAQEAAGTKSWNESYNLCKISFTHRRSVTGNAVDCYELECP